jgi:hypothetical protein
MRAVVGITPNTADLRAEPTADRLLLIVEKERSVRVSAWLLLV